MCHGESLEDVDAGAWLGGFVWAFLLCALFVLFSGAVVVVGPLESIRSFTYMYICNYASPLQYINRKRIDTLTDYSTSSYT